LQGDDLKPAFRSPQNLVLHGRQPIYLSRWASVVFW
jgi:hypothetical protein